MTLTVLNTADFESKRALKEKLDRGIYLHDPSIMNSWTRNSKDLEVGFSDTITNHPKRTKFAKIVKTAGGWRVT